MGYLVNYKAENDPDWTSTQVSSSNISINNLVSCTNYEFQLATICTQDTMSGFSDTLYYTTECICEPPQNVDTINVTQETATILWEAAENASSYLIRYRQFNLIDWKIYETDDISGELDSLNPCTFYQYQVQTICPIGSSEFSPMTIFKTLCTVGNYNVQGVANINIFPNPVDDKLRIDLDLISQKDISIQLFNTSGQLIHATDFGTRSQGHNQLFLKNLDYIPTGLYILKIKLGNQFLLKKIIKE